MNKTPGQTKKIAMNQSRNESAEQNIFNLDSRSPPMSSNRREPSSPTDNFSYKDEFKSSLYLKENSFKVTNDALTRA
jgi:hypothetical protein